MRKWNAWTSQEIALLIERYPALGARSMAASQLLGAHSEYSIRQMAYELGVKYRRPKGPRPPRKSNGGPCPDITPAEIERNKAEVLAERRRRMADIDQVFRDGGEWYICDEDSWADSA